MPRPPESDFGASFWRDVFAPREKFAEVSIDADDERLLDGRRDVKFLDPSQDTTPLGDIWLENKPSDSEPST